MPLRPLLLVLALLSALAASPVSAQVRRCTGADGATVFTDRKCPEVGGIERVPHNPGTTGTSGTRAYRGGCARTVQDLMFEMTGAFDTRDANRLAGIYHWAGMSGDNAYAVLARLDAMVQRPLVDIVPVMPTPPRPPPSPIASETGASVAADFADDAGDDSDTPAVAEDDGNYYPQTSVRQTPVALRIEQTLVNGSTPSRTVFGLRKHYGCWWLQL